MDKGMTAEKWDPNQKFPKMLLAKYNSQECFYETC